MLFNFYFCYKSRLIYSQLNRRMCYGCKGKNHKCYNLAVCIREGHLFRKDMVIHEMPEVVIIAMCNHFP